MADTDITAFGNDIALAIRARGQSLADLTGDPKSAEFLRAVYEDAANVAELRTQVRRMGAHLKGAK